MIRTLSEIEIEGYFLIMVKYVCLSLKTGILCSGESLTTFPLKYKQGTVSTTTQQYSGGVGQHS